MRWLLGLLVVMCGLAAVWWFARDDRSSTAATGAGAGSATAVTPGGKVTGPAAALPRAPRPSAGTAGAAVPSPAPAPRAALPGPDTPARDLVREKEVRGTLDFMLAGHRSLYELKTIECLESGQCHVELEVTDMDAFRSPYARLSEPGGFPDTFGAMVLAKPEPIAGAGAKAVRVKFDLLPKVPE